MRLNGVAQELSEKRFERADAVVVEMIRDNFDADPVVLIHFHDPDGQGVSFVVELSASDTTATLLPRRIVRHHCCRASLRLSQGLGLTLAEQLRLAADCRASLDASCKAVGEPHEAVRSNVVVIGIVIVIGHSVSVGVRLAHPSPTNVSAAHHAYPAPTRAAWALAGDA